MFGSEARAAMGTGQAQNSGATNLRLSRREKHDLVEQLSAFDAFNKCSRDDLGALVDAGKPFTLPANWALIAEGAAAESFYAITRGQARVYRGRVQVAELGPGSVVGEMALLTGRPRQATVTSSSRLAGVRIGNDVITELFAHHPHLLQALREVFEAHLAAQPTAAP